jgi:Domain of unknown function (DUF4263)
MKVFSPARGKTTKMEEPMVKFSMPYSPTTEFSMTDGDLSALEIRDAQNETGFYYFYDTSSRRLITDFVLTDRPQVALMCQVTLIRKVDRYTPRIRLWRKDKTKAGKEVLELAIPDTSTTRLIKATVDTDDGHENFWKLISYLQSLTELDVPRDSFRLVSGDSAKLAALLESEDKAVIVQAVQTALGASLTDEDISLMANRKQQVDRFRRLLEEDDYFEAERARLQKGPEALWQNFFEENTWIFGYGLSLVTHESLDDGKLERITTGANVFGGGGKRIDAIMRTRALISSLLFCEIKRHDTRLLNAELYRPPDVYRPSEELSGGTAQLQKTVRKAIRQFTTQVLELTQDDGSRMGIEFSTTRPRQVLLIGNLDQFRSEAGINGEMMESFELYRRSIIDLEVITFDELYERAQFIAGDH